MSSDDDAPREDHSEAHEADGPPARRPREPVFNLPGVVLALLATCVMVHVARYALLDPRQDLGLVVRFAFIPARYTGDVPIDLYAFISPFSYSLLHGSAAHLVINMIWLAAFGSPLANRLGPGRFLLFWAVTALAAVLLHFIVHPSEAVPVVGASGAISGMMGAAARFAFRIDRSSGKSAFAGDILPMSAVLRSRVVVAFLGVWMLVNLAAGIGFGSPGGAAQIAWEAHIGGFVAGFFGVPVFDRLRRAPGD